MIRQFVLPLGFLLTLMLPTLVHAQTTLLADQIDIDPRGVITATGEVVVFHEGTELRARAVRYDRRIDRLDITGPIRVIEPGGTVLIAEAASLDRALGEGILNSARLVLDEQLQLAAARIAREGNRYIRLDRVVASSCSVCPENPTPLWEIRARSVVHDRAERQLYFEQAQVRVVGVPVFWLPRLRLPGPGLDRATGFLLPDLASSSQLGTGIKIPYFIVIGDHADLRLTPYLSSRTHTLEVEGRAVLPRGRLQMTGAMTDDELEGRRAYAFVDFAHRLPRNFLLEAQFELVSDPGYLFTYGYQQRDRLTNQIRLSRVRDKDLMRASLTEFRTLREDEVPLRDQQTDRHAEVTYRREIEALSFGGRTELRFDAAALNRPSSDDIVGRDVSRIGGGIDWRGTTVLGPGIVASGELGFRGDLYNIGQDSRFDTNVLRKVPRAAVELRWPFVRQGADGMRDTLEPVLRIDWEDPGGGEVPLEDSRVIEFDVANLVSGDRYPGIDGVEDGARGVAALFWHRDAPQGWTVDLAFGRIFAFDGDLGFAEGTGLQGDRSEWIVAAGFALGEELHVMSRSLFEDDFDFTLNETRLNWRRDTFDLSAAYISADPEPAEGRLSPLSEISASGTWRINDLWTASAETRYDFNAGRAARSQLGLGYRSECIAVGVSVSRRYASSTSVEPTTEFGVRLSLVGLGDEDGRRAPRRVCRG